MSATAQVDPRSLARLAAVQALFQLEMSGGDSARIITEFRHHRLGQNEAELPGGSADETLFTAIVDGVDAHRDTLDGRIAQHLASGWSMARLDSTLRQVLRAAAFELLLHRDTPAPVIINEYVEVAHAFAERSEAGFVNSVLDALAKSTRA